MACVLASSICPSARAHRPNDRTTQRPVSFLNEVEPILTRAGCNAGACHGAQFGKGGFKLSLAAYDPDLDYEALVKLQGGRRVNRTDPTNSLFLKKPTLALPHQGGARITSGSADYWTLVRWIQQCAPGPNPKDPSVVAIRVIPVRRTMKPGQSIHLTLRAIYSNGLIGDVTGHTRIDALNDAIATATPEGVVMARASGATAVMLRYAGLATVAYVDVPYKPSVERQAVSLKKTALRRFQPVNYIDALASRRWMALGLEPSPVCTDTEFLRRASLDIIGTLPAHDEVREFRRDRDPHKRWKLVDRLLDRPEYVDHWALKWADLLRSTRMGLGGRAQAALNRWIRDSLAENKPYDTMVRELITAQGSSISEGPANYFRVLNNPNDLAETTAELFLGVRLQCTKCHHHPFEKWSQRDYYQFAAYFARIGTPPGANPEAEQIVRPHIVGEVTHPKTGQRMEPRPLVFGEGERPTTTSTKTTRRPNNPTTQDRREALAAWLTSASNRPFARLIVNRYWAALMGRGIVQPVDDVRVTNPPSNPELLDALAADFVKHDFDVKWLIRTIGTSRVYQLSSAPTPGNRADDVFFSHRLARRQPAEVMLDSVARAAGASEKFAGLPLGTLAIQLPDSGVASMFLDTFGRPPRTTSCECERPAEPSLSQALQMLNGDLINRLITSSNGRIARLIKDGRSDREIVDELYLATLTRLPRDHELRTAMAAFERSKSRQQASEDLLWALINTREFAYIR